MATIDETIKANRNVAKYEELIRKTGAIESQVLEWIVEAASFHAEVEEGDKQIVLDLRADLISRLRAAMSI